MTDWRALVLTLVATVVSAQSDRTLSAESPALQVAFLDGGKTVAALCRDGSLRLWDARSGNAMPSRAEQAMTGMAVFIPGTNQIAALDAGGSIRLRQAVTGAPAAEVPAIEPRPGTFAVSDDGSRVATAQMLDRQLGVNTVRVRDVTGKEVFRSPAGIGDIAVLTFSPDGSKLVAGSNDADLRVWNTRNGELVRLIDELPVTMFAAAFSPDGKRLATAGADRTVYVWDTSAWKLLRKITGQPEMISALDFSPDGRRIVTGGFSELTMQHPVSMIVWDVETGKQLRSMPAPRRVSGLAFAPDGRQLASVYGDGAINLWRVPD